MIYDSQMCTVRRCGGAEKFWSFVLKLPYDPPYTPSASTIFRLSRQASKDLSLPPLDSTRASLQGATSNFRLQQYNVHMLRLAVRTNVPKLQPPNTCKPGYHLFCIALLTPGEDKHGLSRLSQLRPFRTSTRKLHLTSS
jgi:hypothetical protein